MTQLIATYTKKAEGEAPRLRLWLQWVFANAGAEMIGLGASALLWIAMLMVLEERVGILLSALLVVVGSTILEGTAVGIGQWFVLRRHLPALRWQSWLLATAMGALVAWTLGMVPSTMMNLSESSAIGDTAVADAPVISDFLMYSLAALMGLLLGPILALPQWWVLRRHLARAVWWIPANALAWAAGMVIIFVGVGLIPVDNLTWTVIPLVLGSLAVAGAVVGAIHGIVLLWLLATAPGNRLIEVNAN